MNNEHKMTSDQKWLLAMIAASLFSYVIGSVSGYIRGTNETLELVNRIGAEKISEKVVEKIKGEMR